MNDALSGDAAAPASKAHSASQASVQSDPPIINQLKELLGQKAAKSEASSKAVSKPPEVTTPGLSILDQVKALAREIPAVPSKPTSEPPVPEPTAAELPAPSILAVGNLEQPRSSKGGLSLSQRSTIVAAVSMACLATVISVAAYAVIFVRWAGEESAQKWLPVRPPTTILDVGLGIIRMETCRAAWNFRVSKAIAAGSQSLTHAFMDEPSGSPFVLNGVPGTRYLYSSPALPGLDICGWYFIPLEYFLQKKSLAETIAKAHTSAIKMNLASFNAAASPIKNLIPDDAYADSEKAFGTNIIFNPLVQDAVEKYEQDVHKEINKTNPDIEIYDYPADENEQKDENHIAERSIPITRLPFLGYPYYDNEFISGRAESNRNDYNESAWSIRVAVALDMIHYDDYLYQ